MFSKDWEDCLDFSDEMLIELFNGESYGTRISPKNGFSVGKKWLNLNISMWPEDMEKGNLQLWELYEDPKFPHWWLDKVFKSDPEKTKRPEK